mmetsp:Transcript_106762/g.300107  ORF Transcript_106762/g.300107 Transcript_106762/m.300107 type:complete len:485 (-) Transcript_106762:55-1509(-)
MGAELPASLVALLTHVQERALSATSERLAGRLVRLLQAISPRIVTEGGAGEEVRCIDLGAVRGLCAEGIPDEVPALRAAIWKVLLGYLPKDVFSWDSVLASSRAAHAGFVTELLEQLTGCTRESRGSATPNSDGSPSSADEQTAQMPPVAADAEVSRTTSCVNLEDILEQVNKDIYRTRPELDFFARRLDGQDDEAFEDRVAFRGGEGRSMQPVDVHSPRRHYDVLARVLLLYGRLNPGVRYVQGMNELCAPLYYLFAQDPLQNKNVEADTFFCFSLVMADMRDSFVQSLDQTDSGMIGRIEQFDRLLRKKDHEVWQHLDAERVSPLYYSVRWLTLMLTQELEMPDVHRVWDSLLSDVASRTAKLSDQPSLLIYICVAMVARIRAELLAADFTKCVGMLQHYSAFSVEELLQSAADLQAYDASARDAGHGDSGWRIRRQGGAYASRVAATFAGSAGRGEQGRAAVAWMRGVARWFDGFPAERRA